MTTPPQPFPRDALVAWYLAVARDLPWRRTRDPYAIWVSEVMLQQTRVDTVVPYFERFLDRFPTVARLADAPEDEVLAAWSGLGYYRRARWLQAGARAVVAEHGGEVPREQSARKNLPGVGPYTAGAIGSIAFGLAEPIVDGNVARVLSRFHGVETPLGRADTERRLWSLAEAVVAGASRPGTVNQGLMELGATVCTDQRPACDACPVASGCEARRTDRQGDLPVRRKKTPPRRVELVAVVPRGAGDGPDAPTGLWLGRGDRALFGGLWGPLLGERGGAPSERVARALLRDAGLRAAAIEPGEPVRHVLTHRHLRVTTFAAHGVRGTPRGDLRPFPESDLGRVGVSRLTRKVLSAVPDAPSAPRQLRVLIDP